MLETFTSSRTNSPRHLPNLALTLEPSYVNGEIQVGLAIFQIISSRLRYNEVLRLDLDVEIDRSLSFQNFHERSANILRQSECYEVGKMTSFCPTMVRTQHNGKHTQTCQ